MYFKYMNYGACTLVTDIVVFKFFTSLHEKAIDFILKSQDTQQNTAKQSQRRARCQSLADGQYTWSLTGVSITGARVFEHPIVDRA